MAIVYSSYSTTSITLNSVSPATVEDDGGYQFNINGNFRDEAATIAVVVGGIEYPCYGGVSGQGSTPKPKSPSLLIAVTPPLARGGPYNIIVRQGAYSTTINSALTVVARNWKDRTFAVRRVLPPWYKTGPRNLDSVDLLT